MKLGLCLRKLAPYVLNVIFFVFNANSVFASSNMIELFRVTIFKSNARGSIVVSAPVFCVIAPISILAGVSAAQRISRIVEYFVFTSLQMRIEFSARYLTC
uniref:Uncharacterized protein n=1 Tax=Ixodes ricinus TaxID=34613 RepID=A0A6B0UIB8_IXORI